ncbi:MAG: DUF2637 domain-containing protein [Streptosporangiaceae bacterium]
MTGDTGIRRMAAVAVLLVAAIAAVISYVHIERLAVTHGQAVLAAYLLPLSIDGTVAAASLVLLRAARAGLSAPWLAQAMLGLAVVATLAANVAYGARFGITGSLLSGWPAVAFIGSAEMAIGMTRRARAGTSHPSPVPALAPVPAGVPADVPGPEPVPGPGYGLNGHGADAERVFAAELAAGDVPGIRRIRAELHVGQPRAREIQAHLERLTPAARSIRRIRDEIRQAPPGASDPASGAPGTVAGQPPRVKAHDTNGTTAVRRTS